MIEGSKKQHTPKDLREKDWLLEMLERFNHPSTALWRAVEARCIHSLLSKFILKDPALDLGCGDGKFSSTIFSRGIMNVGLDISKDDIIKAKKISVYEALIVGDAQTMPFRKESFRVVFSNCVIEHIPNVDKVLTEISKILKEDGVFIFTVPSERFGKYLFLHVLLQKIHLKKLAHWYSKKRNELLNHYNCYDPVTWKHKIESVGLNMVVSKYYLSKSAIQIWDFLAICIFIMRRVGIFRTAICSLLLAKTRKIRASVFKRLLYKYYNQNCKVGGGLLITTKK